MWQNSCYRSCAYGQSLVCLQLRADEAKGSIQWKMTLYPRLCVKSADNSDKSYCNRMRSILIWYKKNWERSDFNGRPFFLTQYTCGFLPRILAIFFAQWFFVSSKCPFSSLASVPRQHALKKHAYIYAKTNMRIWVIAGRRIYKTHRIIPLALNRLCVP